MQLVRILLTHFCKAVRWHDVCDIQLARAITIQLRHLLRYHVIPHFVDRRSRIIPVLLVATQCQY